MYIKCLFNQYTHKLFRGWLDFTVFSQSGLPYLFCSLHVFDFPFAFTVIQLHFGIPLCSSLAAKQHNHMNNSDNCRAGDKERLAHSRGAFITKYQDRFRSLCLKRSVPEVPHAFVAQVPQHTSSCLDKHLSQLSPATLPHLSGSMLQLLVCTLANRKHWLKIYCKNVVRLSKLCAAIHSSTDTQGKTYSP